MKNDKGNKTRRRKVALQNLEKQLHNHRSYMVGGRTIVEGSSFTEEEKQRNEVNRIRIEKEIVILKQRIGNSIYDN